MAVDCKIIINFATQMKRKIVFVMNPISGTASKAGIPKLIDETIDKERFDYEIRMTEYAGHASEIASEAKEQGVDAVVAVGGDGTVNEVARAIVHSNTALGIIPCGSGNGLARHLMLPMNTKKSIEIINLFAIHDLDYGIINGRFHQHEVRHVGQTRTYQLCRECAERRTHLSAGDLSHRR